MTQRMMLRRIDEPLTTRPRLVVRDVGQLASEGYQAVVSSTQQLVYRLNADIDPAARGLRIGSRGTAQLQGARVPLLFYLLRRPISAARQYIGL